MNTSAEISLLKEVTLLWWMEMKHKCKRHEAGSETEPKAHAENPVGG